MNKSKGSSEKSKKADELSKKLSKYKTLALVEVSGFPSSNFERIKKTLRGSADFVYTNKIIIYNALKLVNSPLADKVEGIRLPVLLLSNLNPFDIVKTAVENKAYAKIKAGEKANEDITLLSGPTPFPPGPMLSQFSSIGVKTKNEGGKISIISDTKIVKKGEVVNDKVASILSSMDIKPKELILSILYAFNDKIVFGRETLYKNSEEYVDELKNAFLRSLSLSVSVGILNKYSVKSLIKKIYIGVRFLSVDRNIVSKSTINDILAKASVQAGAIDKVIGGK
ncbi:MAG: 50S ribosomal protein L10 [Candidatus Parvarchaeota archaeon]|nr:50S ribosomal protein L10 [Candidatus Parvarchaeota archaeon]